MRLTHALPRCDTDAATHGAAITKHHVYIADRNDNRIHRVDVSLP